MTHGNRYSLQVLAGTSAAAVVLKQIVIFAS